MLEDLVLQGGGRVSVHNQVRTPKEVIQNLRVPHTGEYYNELALIAKIYKLNFPKYDGFANPLPWICQIE